MSFKTRYERANLLRHFFRELEFWGGLEKAPDLRNLGQGPIQTAVDPWRTDGLKPSAIQTCLGFLRGLAGWLGKPGFIRRPAYYGLELAEYQRSGINERDKSWSAQGPDVDGLIDKVAAWGNHAHTGDPDRDLKQNMVRFGYVLRKFGIASKGLGITAHGLRHEALIEEYIAITGQEPPLRDGAEGLTREQEDAARLAVSRLAGYKNRRASAAYLGAVLHEKKGGANGSAGAGAVGGGSQLPPRLQRAPPFLEVVVPVVDAFHAHEHVGQAAFGHVRLHAQGGQLGASGAAEVVHREVGQAVLHLAHLHAQRGLAHVRHHAAEAACAGSMYSALQASSFSFCSHSTAMVGSGMSSG